MLLMLKKLLSLPRCVRGDITRKPQLSKCYNPYHAVLNVLLVVTYETLDLLTDVHKVARHYKKTCLEQKANGACYATN